MEVLNQTHPGAKEELLTIGISVKRNEKGIGQAVDLAGEQSYMRSAKTAGVVTDFQTQAETVRKWVLSRPYQAKFTEALKTMANLDRTSDNLRKCLRAWRHSLPIHFVTILINNGLYNLVSGEAVLDSIAESMFFKQFCP